REGDAQQGREPPGRVAAQRPPPLRLRPPERPLAPAGDAPRPRALVPGGQGQARARPVPGHHRRRARRPPEPGPRDPDHWLLIRGVLRRTPHVRSPGRSNRATLGPVAELPDVIPLFPLPGVVLFPRVSLPLHVFEPRYKKMVSDALSGPQIIGMTLLQPGWESD